MDPAALTTADHTAILALVEEIRHAEGAGGQCGFVAEVLATRYDWDMHGGIYHSTDGHPIGDHVWNHDAATDTLIDATADQFGEGAAVRILAASDPTALRYRWAESDEQEDAWLDAARARRDRDGDYWWVPGGITNPDAAAYLAKVAAYEAY